MLHLDELSSAEIEQLALADLQNRATRTNETVELKSIELNKTYWGRTTFFQHCYRINFLAESTWDYIRGKSFSNWCNPFMSIWRVILTVHYVVLS